VTGQQPSALTLREIQDGDVRVLEISGELVIETAAELERSLIRVGAAEHVVLDLTNASFMDSTGLRVVLINHDRIRAGGHECVLVAVPDGQVEGLLAFVDVREALEVEPTRVSALARIRGG
jgi:anti-sigma B factor antagonist